MDPAFKVIPRKSTCFLIWRVENFQLVPVPSDQYGCFYDGDSYLILAVGTASAHSYEKCVFCTKHELFS